MAVAAAGATLAVSGSPATAGTRTDAYIRDVPGDVGNEPDTATPGPYYESPDIKICNTAVPCAYDQMPTPGGTSYVFVNLNVPGPHGSGASTGTLWVYHTVPGSAPWPGNWALVNHVSLTAYPDVTQATVPWPNVPSTLGGHFCLMAVWVSSTDPMAATPTPPYTSSVNYAIANNNVAQHNVTRFSLGGRVAQLPFGMGNAVSTRSLNDLALSEPEGDFVADGGTLTADLGDLFQGWQEAGGRGFGIRPIGGTSVQILDPANARIIGLPVDPGTRPVVMLSFSMSRPSSNEYAINVDEQGPAEASDGPTDLGGVRYQFTVDQG